MTSAELITLYDYIGDSDEEIAKIRGLVLDLAVRGRLVAQEEHNGTASDLLSAINHELKRPAAATSFEHSSPAPLPHIPDTWAWSRLGDLCSKTGSGSTPRGGQAAYKSAGIPFLRSQNVYDDGLRLLDVAYIDEETHARMAGTAVLPLDLLLNITGGSIGRCCVVPNGVGEANISQHVAIIRPALTAMAPFLHCVVRSPFFQWFIGSEQTGAGRGGLPKNRMDQIPVPLPPLPEQHRIVAKVDELMALCDQLEAARREREAARDRLAAASLVRLNAPDTDTFQADARFALNVMPALSARPDQVKQLRQTILNLAVRGKLVKQDPADEPASELLRRVSSARRLSTAEQARRSEGEMGAMRPRGWEQVAWSQVCDFVTSGSRGWAEYYATSGACFIRAQNIRFGTLLLDNLACVRPPKSAEGSRTQVRMGDLLVVITGAGVTNPALLDRDLGEAYISQHVALVRPNDGQLSRWLLLCMMADEGGRAELVRCAYGSGKPGLNLDNIRTLRSPLPPLAEQRRIVAKVDELMALCDQLEESLNRADTVTSRLLDALLHEAIVSTEVAV